MRAVAAVAQERGGQGFWVRRRPSLQLVAELLVSPDLAAWPVQQLAMPPDEQAIHTAPSFCAEVLMPQTASEVRRIKLALYAQAGVGWIWLADPALELVEIFEVQGGRLIRVDAAKTTDARPLAPFTVEIALGASGLRLRPRLARR